MVERRDAPCLLFLEDRFFSVSNKSRGVGAERGEETRGNVREGNKIKKMLEREHAKMNVAQREVQEKRFYY